MSLDIDNLFDEFTKIKVAVIGDVMLDTYWWGNVERISPEAPVPMVAVSKREQRIGGAGNVALNLQALGSSVALLSILGDDEDGAQLKKLLQEKNIDTRFILESKKRITTNKIRIISRNQHMMRLDAEMVHDIDDVDEKKLKNKIEKFIITERPKVVILEDYNKGILTKNIIEYQNATLFKPNLSEAITGLNLLPEEISKELLSEIHLQLKEKLGHQISLITLSEKGVFYQENNSKDII